MRLSRARAQQLIEGGHVVGPTGTLTKAAHKLRGGERLAVSIPAPGPLSVSPENIPLDILFEDEHLIAVNKPAGMVVHPGAGVRTGTLVHALLGHCRDLSGVGGVLRPGIVHRLDRGTSGVIVAAKDDATHQALAEQFARREVDKRYVAFVCGTPREHEATIRTYFGRHPTQRQRFTGRLTSGKIARTSYRVRAATAGLARLIVRLWTGRTHQIRVHLSELGHPIVGDPVYGGRGTQRISDDELRALATALTHQALHAARLAFSHPRSRELIVLRARLPSDLEALWSRMQRLLADGAGSDARE